MNSITQIKEKNSVFSKCVDVDIDFQESLMSYQDDILKIIRCNVFNNLTNTDYDKGTLTVYGQTKICITYVSETTSCITTADFDEDFKKVIQMDCDCDDVSCDVILTDKYNNYRIVNQRRIDVHCCFSLNINGICVKQIEMFDSGENLMVKKDAINYFSFVGFNFAKAEFEEDIVIPSDSSVVKKIINTFYSVSIDDIKIIKDKMLIKFIVDFSFLYTTDTEKEEIKRCEKNITLSKIIDINGIDDGDIPLVNSNLSNVYVKPKADVNNELRVIDVAGELYVHTSVYRSVESVFSFDSYSPSFLTENTFDKIQLNTDGAFVNDTFLDTALFEFDNVNIVEILDLNLSINKENELILSAYIVDENSKVVFISKKSEITLGDFKNISCFIKSFDYVIKSPTSISIRYSVEYSAVNYKQTDIKVLTSVDNKGDYEKDTPTLIVYFAKPGENLWDIAKKFRSSSDLIKKENNINEDVIGNSRVLLIPGV